MAGGSYVGITQYLAAEQQPPHLVAIVPQVAISDLYRDGFAHGGIPNLFFDLQYIGVQGAPGAAGANTDPSLLAATLAAKLGQSPPGSIAFDYLSRPDDDTFYRDRSPIYHADRINVPVLDIGAWRDGLLRGETEMYSGARAPPRRRDAAAHEPVHAQGLRRAVRAADEPTGPAGRRRADLRVPQPSPARHAGAGAPARRALRPGRQHLRPRRLAGRPTGTRYERYELGAGSLAIGKRGARRRERRATSPTRLAGFSMAFDRFGTVAASPYVPTDQRLEGPQGLHVPHPDRSTRRCG